MRELPPDVERARRGRELATTWSIVLMALGLAASVGGPNWLVGREFLVYSAPEAHLQGVHESLWRLVTEDTTWAVSVAAYLVPPLWFWWWRRSATVLGSSIGLALCAAAALGATICVHRTPPWMPPHRMYALEISALTHGGYWWTLPLAAVFYAAGFLVAPAPRDADAASDLEVRRLVRRHRDVSDRAP